MTITSTSIGDAGGSGTIERPAAHPAVDRLTIDPITAAAVESELRAVPLARPAPAGQVDARVRAVLDRHLADRMTGPLRSLRLPDGPAALVVDGLPIVDDPGPTPIDGTPTDERLAVCKSVVAWLAERIGAFPCGYPNIAGGRFHHDVNPVQGTIRQLSSKGAELDLPHHTDSAANDDRPDYLVLWSVKDGRRSETEDVVLTGYAPVTAAISLLSEETVERLRQPEYRIQVPTIVDDSTERWSEPVPVISGPDAAPEIRFHATRIESTTPTGAASLDALRSALDSVAVPVELAPGRLLVLNNRRGTHARNGFTPRYDKHDRWLLRTYLLSDPWVHRRVLVAGDALIGSPVDAASLDGDRVPTVSPSAAIDGSDSGDAPSQLGPSMLAPSGFAPTPGTAPSPESRPQTRSGVDLMLSEPAAAVRHLLAGIGDRRPSASEARSIIDATPSMLPLAIDATGGGSGRPEVLWADLGGHDPQEWQVVYSLEAAVEAGAVGERFTTGLDVLADGPPPDALDPTGFVFHMSRCGSTLVSRALARSPRHVALSQPGVFRDGIWAVLTDGWTRAPEPTPDRLALFASLVGHLLRRRRDDQCAAFIKFFSENTVFLDFIRAAFDTTPCLFLYREPVEVAASVARRGSGMQRARGTLGGRFHADVSADEESAMADGELIARYFGRFFDTVLASPRQGMTVVEYPDLTADRFPQLLQDGFGYTLPDGERDAVLDQFGYHSKSDPSDPRRFVDDSERKRAAVDPGFARLLADQLGPSVDQLRSLAWRPGSPHDTIGRT